MFRQLQEINTRPAPFEQCTVADLWTDEHTSSQMLAFHLDGSVDLSSRNTEFIDRSARWIVSRFDLDQSKCVADFGCGPGLYTTRLAASGAAVTGIDFSDRSLRYARESSERQSLSVEYVHADYLEYETSRRFDLIAMIMCDFCALSPPQRRTMLDKFLALLKPGGSVLLDVYSLHAFDEREEIATYAPELLDGFWSSKPYFGFLNTFKYQAEKVTLDKYTIVEETRTRVIYNWLQHFDREALGKEFENSAFVVEEFPGDVAGAAFDPESQEFAIVARKPA
jgi:SAM-dependent methyltransferase